MPASGSITSELRVLLRIGAPLMVAYIAELAMFLITRMVVGDLGYESLAAVGVSGDLTFELLVVAMGAMSVIGVLLAQAVGAGDEKSVGHALNQGMLVATILGLASTAVVWCIPIALGHLGQEPVVVELATPYLWALSGCVLPTLWFTALRSFVTAIGKTRSIMVITIGAVGVQWFFTEGLVHGKYGLPELGVAGAGWSMTIATWMMFAALFGHVLIAGYGKSFGWSVRAFRFDKAICRDIVRLGVPSGFLVALESGLFAAVSVLSGVIGAKALAAHQIALSWVGLPFVIALGLAEGAMVRVAHGIGRGDRAAARRSGIVSITLAVVIATALIIVPVFYGDRIVELFLSKDQRGADEVTELALHILIIVAVFQVFDGLQAVAARALRGLQDTVKPLWIAGFGYWIVGIGGGSIAAFHLNWGAPGLWWGLAGGLIFTGACLCGRFMLLTRSTGP